MSTISIAPVRRALLSVSDKMGLIPLARGLHERNVALIASGGTAQALAHEGIPAEDVSSVTGAPEILDGRVKTLHPAIHAGILADRRQPEHLQILADQGFQPIDLVVCNLYPFSQALQAGAEAATLVECIDIGGPTLVRASAKNADGGTTVVCDPNDYGTILELLDQHQGIPLEMRHTLRAKAFGHTALYDMTIAQWAGGSHPPASTLVGGFERVRELRYGENPHQPAALYRLPGEPGIANANALSGKELSYNNYLDLDAAWRAVQTFAQPACAIVKHTNPCGLSCADTVRSAFAMALEGDRLSAFGGIVAFNRPIAATDAEAILASKLFIECIVAPGFEDGALNALKTKTNLRLVTCVAGSATNWNAHRISGGLLVQETDVGITSPSSWTCATPEIDCDVQDEALAFAMRTVGLLKSNAIAVSRGTTLLGMGAGQTSRVDAVAAALSKAGEKARGAILSSDAFFPFPDSIELAHEAGIAAVVQPGGSKKDPEVIAACQKHGIGLWLTGRRHFRH